MKIDEFNNLPLLEQYDITFRKGVFIEYFFNGNQRFALYSLYKFFIEVEYDVIANKIKNIISFEDGNLLGKYTFFR